MPTPVYEVFKDVKDQFRFNLLDARNEIILASLEGYQDESDCKQAVAICKVNSCFDLYYEKQMSDGRYFFLLLGNNQTAIARSEYFATAVQRDEAIEQVKKVASSAAVFYNTATG